MNLNNAVNNAIKFFFEQGLEPFDIEPDMIIGEVKKTIPEANREDILNILYGIDEEV